jgi:cellobiose phosphorylase
VTYGFGYCKYTHNSDGIEQDLEVFVPKEDSCKVEILTLKNTTPNRKKIKLYYYMKPVIGEDEIKSNGFIHIDYDKNNNLILAENLYKGDIEKTKVYSSCSEEISSYTGDKKFFFGNGDISNPEALRKIMLNNEDSLGKKACIAYEVEIELESFAQKEISIILGAEGDNIDCKNVAYKYSKISNCKQELEKIKNFWKELLGRVQVYTPLESMNIIVNGWAPYQVIVSRLLGRSGYYQSGGAYGFRDQLQDTMALKYFNPEILKNQIILHSKHQFLEGDVEHWWHKENERGIRTRMSDDLLWLAYLTSEYINFTDDKSILEIKTPYLEGRVLEDSEIERYEKYISSDKEETIYEHCIRAIDRTLEFGENGLPKIGTGDWNDGFSEVGKDGKGESVWLGFFLYAVLDNFIPICRGKNDEEKANKYDEIRIQLKKNLNTNGWDGRWYKRAFMDDGNWLGSMENDECRIDSIAQSWSVISNAGDNDKKYISMESLENHLIDRENGIIKLLDPPFDKGKLEPGYIKAYLPGVRENGGQYTHAAVWVILAETMLGFGDKALEFYRMINPIEHARTKEASKKYKVEPFVIPADIYGIGNLAGRGGWTWYTGSASWYYKVGIEYILGMRVENGFIRFNPCISKAWKEYEIKYRWKESIYNIKVNNPDGKNTGVEKVILNGVEVENKIKLDGSNKIYNIEVIM